jgi:hypothetical protein
MKKKHFLTYAKRCSLLAGFAVLLIAAIFTLAGCLTTLSSAKNAPDEVGDAAVEEATEAAKEKAREGIRNIFN